MVEFVIAGLGILTGTISIFTSYSKLQNVLNRLEKRDLELKEQIHQIQLKLEHQSDKTELLFNGLKEKIEHVKLRVTTDLKQTHTIVSDVESYLQKNTPYERRSH
ncbi:MAG: hypothetical protein HC827_05830 [Cyanobacteria bacterium RM1_2_2]|nr:hypothetical protein [Cyanobacteria bacterium RM1_2_2]